MFSLLEQDCHELDVALTCDQDNGIEGGASYANFVEDNHRADNIKKQLEE